MDIESILTRAIYQVLNENSQNATEKVRKVFCLFWIFLYVFCLFEGWIFLGYVQSDETFSWTIV